ncbi:hypothetical protein F4604DRAFT_1903886 [Suillus subluteus]|nr:hypothetical protein F4604DRAFT_1903886 [Suillus subluteus]
MASDTTKYRATTTVLDTQFLDSRPTKTVRPYHLRALSLWIIFLSITLRILRQDRSQAVSPLRPDPTLCPRQDNVKINHNCNIGRRKIKSFVCTRNNLTIPYGKLLQERVKLILAHSCQGFNTSVKTVKDTNENPLPHRSIHSTVVAVLSVRYCPIDGVLDELKLGIYRERRCVHAVEYCFLQRLKNTVLQYLHYGAPKLIGATIVLYMGDGGGAFLLIHIHVKEASSIKPYILTRVVAAHWYTGKESSSEFCTCACVPAAKKHHIVERIVR